MNSNTFVKAGSQNIYKEDYIFREDLNNRGC